MVFGMVGEICRLEAGATVARKNCRLEAGATTARFEAAVVDEFYEDRGNCNWGMARMLPIPVNTRALILFHKWAHGIPSGFGMIPRPYGRKKNW
jgi:hypothetical protein